jgi:hypothetical protein
MPSSSPRGMMSSPMPSSSSWMSPRRQSKRHRSSSTTSDWSCPGSDWASPRKQHSGRTSDWSCPGSDWATPRRSWMEEDEMMDDGRVFRSPKRRSSMSRRSMAEDWDNDDDSLADWSMTSCGSCGGMKTGGSDWSVTRGASDNGRGRRHRRYPSSEGPFCGTIEGTFPVNSRERGHAALAYRRYDTDPERVKHCVCERSKAKGWNFPSCEDD